MAKLVLKEPKQWQALFANVRLEIIEALELYGPCSIAEIAAELNRTPHSLYHHFRQLVDADIVTAVDSRRSGARDEAVYDLCGRPVIVDLDVSTPKARALRVKAARYLLRRAERDYTVAIEAAADDESLVPEVRRYRVRLRESSIDRIREHLDAVVEIVLNERLRAADEADDSRWINWLTLLAPEPPDDKS